MQVNLLSMIPLGILILNCRSRPSVGEGKHKPPYAGYHGSDLTASTSRMGVGHGWLAAQI